MTAPAVGIDLGTTYSCVAVFRNGKVEIIPNADGNRITPSYVAFTDTQRLVGDAAKSQDFLNPENTIFDAKRLIGRKFNDASVQEDMKYWPFKVVSEDGKIKIQVQVKGERKTFFPEEVSSMVLSKMKETAELHLGKPVKKAVVTVPAYFNDSQRQATADAAAIAGLHVLRIINEPTAGALAYGLDKCEDERNVLIFDLGGGTFDVSVLTIEEGIFEVRSTAGDTHLGGEDFDTNMVEHFVQEFSRKHNSDLKTDKRALRRLRTACERAKRTLSSSDEASIIIEMLHRGVDFHTTITRSRFEELIKDLIRSTLKPVEQALKDADMKKSDISEVVLVGGSTRIPIVQRTLQEYFDGKELNRSVNPDEAVACGAAVQAAILDGDVSQLITDLVLVDVTPLSLGTEVYGGLMSTIIPRNTTIPTKKMEKYYTVYDNQTTVDVQVLEGERTMANDNNLLGKFLLTGIPPRPRREAEIKVTFEKDANGILHASAVATSANNEKKIMITNDNGRLSKDQIARLVQDAEKYKDEDRKKKERAQAKIKLEDFCLTTRSRIENLFKSRSISAADKRTIFSRCGEILQWLGSDAVRVKEEYEQKQAQLQRICDTILD